MAEETTNTESATNPEEAFLSVLQGNQDAEPVAEETADAVEAEGVEEETEEIEADQSEVSDEAEVVEEEAVTKYVLPVGENGEDVEVDASEINNYLLRQQDYTKKTQTLAEQRKQLEAERNSIRAIQQLGAELKSEFEALRETEDSQPNQEYWNQLKIDNPMQYMIERQEHQDRLRERDQKMRKLQHLQHQMEEQRQLEFQQNLVNEQDKLSQAIPEWDDPEVAQRERQALRLYGISQGYQENEMASVYDHRAVAVLRKAMLWDNLQSKRAGIKTKVLQKPAVGGNVSLNSPSRKLTDLTKAKRQLSKTGSNDDATRAFEALLNS